MPKLLLLRGAMGAGKSSVAKRLKRRRCTITVVEVDPIKKSLYGTAARCEDPAIVFSEAGRLAAEALVSGRDAVVVEPLCDHEHVESVLRGAGLPLESPDVIFVWLDCTLPKAIERKQGKAAREVVEQQHAR